MKNIAKKNKNSINMLTFLLLLLLFYTVAAAAATTADVGWLRRICNIAHTEGI